MPHRSHAPPYEALALEAIDTNRRERHIQVIHLNTIRSYCKHKLGEVPKGFDQRLHARLKQMVEDGQLTSDDHHMRFGLPPDVRKAINQERRRSGGELDYRAVATPSSIRRRSSTRGNVSPSSLSKSTPRKRSSSSLGSRTPRQKRRATSARVEGTVADMPSSPMVPRKSGFGRVLRTPVKTAMSDTGALSSGIRKRQPARAGGSKRVTIRDDREPSHSEIVALHAQLAEVRNSLTAAEARALANAKEREVAEHAVEELRNAVAEHEAAAKEAEEKYSRLKEHVERRRRKDQLTDEGLDSGLQIDEEMQAFEADGFSDNIVGDEPELPYRDRPDVAEVLDITQKNMSQEQVVTRLSIAERTSESPSCLEGARLHAELQTTTATTAERDKILIQVKETRAVVSNATELCETCACLRSEVHELRAAVAELNKERDCARAEFEAQLTKAKEITARAAEREADIVRTMQDIETERDAAVAQVKDIETERDAAVAQVEDIETERDAAVAQVEDIETERDAAVAQVEDIETERDAAVAQVEDIETERDAAVAQVEVLKTEMRGVQLDACAELRKIESELDAARGLVSELTAERDAARAESKELERQRDGVLDKIRTLELEKTQILLESAQEKQNAVSRIGVIQQEKDAADDLAAKMKRERDEACDDRAALEATLSEAHVEIEAFRQEHDASVAKVNALETAKRSAEEAVAGLGQECVQLEEMKETLMRERDAARDACVSLEVRALELDHTLQDVRNELSRAVEQVAAAESRHHEEKRLLEEAFKVKDKERMDEAEEVQREVERNAAANIERATDAAKIAELRIAKMTDELESAKKDADALREIHCEEVKALIAQNTKQREEIEEELDMVRTKATQQAQELRIATEMLEEAVTSRVSTEKKVDEFMVEVEAVKAQAEATYREMETRILEKTACVDALICERDDAVRRVAEMGQQLEAAHTIAKTSDALIASLNEDIERLKERLREVDRNRKAVELDLANMTERAKTAQRVADDTKQSLELARAERQQALMNLGEANKLLDESAARIGVLEKERDGLVKSLEIVEAEAGLQRKDFQNTIDNLSMDLKGRDLEIEELNRRVARCLQLNKLMEINLKPTRHVEDEPLEVRAVSRSDTSAAPTSSTSAVSEDSAADVGTPATSNT